MLEQRIRFPAPLAKGSTIGVTAPSTGVSKALHPRLDRALQNLGRQGYGIKEGRCLRQVVKGASAPKEARAAEFMEFWLDPAISAIIPPWGGMFAIDVLPLLDWDAIGNSSPKWLMGYSDISTLSLALTLRTGIVTAHGTNLMEMIPEQTDPLTLCCLEPLRLQDKAFLRQDSSEFFQNELPADPNAPFHLTERVQWKTLDGLPTRFSGRLLGGCLDTLSTLVGTPYGDTVLMESQDGIIMFLENADFNPSDQYRYLWTLKEAGWLARISGLLLGRSAGKAESNSEYFQQHDLVDAFFKTLGVPVIYDADIGHKPPNLTLLNGAMAEVYASGQGRGHVTIWRK